MFNENVLNSLNKQIAAVLVFAVAAQNLQQISQQIFFRDLLQMRKTRKQFFQQNRDDHDELFFAEQSQKVLGELCDVLVADLGELLLGE